MGIDKQIKNIALDFHAFYYDGSMGGFFNLESLSHESRKKAGFQKGYSEADRIINSASDGETIKIITHSMGGAFGKGFLEGLKQWATVNHITLPELEYIVDIAAYQGEMLIVPEELLRNTIQLSHVDDYIAGAKENGLSWINYHLSSSKNWLNIGTTFGHSISTFRRDIFKWLPESKSNSFNYEIYEENKKK